MFRRVRDEIGGRLREFLRTITIDGCDLRCAARGTEMYSGKPSASIVVSDLAAEHGLSKVEGRRQLNAAGKEAVNLAAQRLTDLVDKLLGPPALIVLNNAIAEERPQQVQSVKCSCGAGIPAKKVRIDGKTVELLELPQIFQQLCAVGRRPETAADELLKAVRIYNTVPPEQEKAYREAIVREYAAFCQEVTT